MRLRSLLFVPGDRPERFARAAASGADAIIIDLEDSVAPTNKDRARSFVADWLSGPHTVPTLVRINPLGGGHARDDIELLRGRTPDGIVLPKADGAASVTELLDRLGRAVPVLPIATETPSALFALASYGEVRRHLLALTWGAEDLPAAIGASSAREADGDYTPPFQFVRSMALFAAHAAGVPAIETVYPAIRDTGGLAAYAARGRRDGFTGMLALHPDQVAPINAAFSPTAEEIADARAVIAAFAAQPGAGVVLIDGRMRDAPHLSQAQAVIARAGEPAGADR